MPIQPNPNHYGNYLRVRGEYQIHFSNNSTKIGTTSACAENTGSPKGSRTAAKNYLRVRGEYISHTCVSPNL